MLQQTLVATVVAYFRKFLSQFPTIHDLAKAEEATIFRMWEGLGYYRRARNMHKTAQLIVSDCQGEFPKQPEKLARLPGLGRYTVNAVLSQAFDLRLPILEANSERVLCRLFGFRDNPKSAPLQKQLWSTAETILPRKRIGDFNQAVMELGALVCTPRSPNCSACPMSLRCITNQHQLQEKIPFRPEKTKFIVQNEVAVIARRNNKVLLVKRPEEGQWAGLWEFPHFPVTGNELHETVAARSFPELTGITVKIGSELTTIKHGITKYKITIVVFHGDYVDGEFRTGTYPEGMWVKPNELDKFPISSPQRKIAKILIRPHNSSLF